MSVRRTPPPFDPELGDVLAALDTEAREPVTPDKLAALRERDAASRPRPTAEDLRADGRFEVSEFRVPGPPGGPEVTLVSARPAGLAGPLPLLYYMHGGAMVMGNAWSVLPRVLREWALPLELAVISVEYRLAPQARYPLPLEDCYAGLVWAAAHAAELDIDPDRVIIGGKSAGGGLAAALALLARDRGGPGALGQLLLCPMLDDRGSTFSSHQMTGLGVWDLTSNATAWKALLGDRYGAEDLPPYAAPARATDLSGLPPAYVEVGSADMFRDEDVAYANAIWQAWRPGRTARMARCLPRLRRHGAEGGPQPGRTRRPYPLAPAPPRPVRQGVPGGARELVRAGLQRRRVRAAGAPADCAPSDSSVRRSGSAMVRT